MHYEPGTNRDNDRELASSFINLCSLYSLMGKHEISLKYAQKANKILRTIFDQMVDTVETDEENKELDKLVQIMGTSYHNTGCQYEHLGDLSNTVKNYLQGFAFCNKYLGKDHAITKVCQ
jgi:LAS superfamily LD-carboxypeptidase LdcB